MDKKLVVLFVYLFGCTFFAALGRHRYYNDSDGEIQSRRSVSLSAVIFAIIGLGVSAFWITCSFYSEISAAALRLTKSTDGGSALSELSTAFAIVMFALCWPVLGCGCYNIGAHCSMKACQKVRNTLWASSQAATAAGPDRHDQPSRSKSVLDPRLAKSFPHQWVEDGVEYHRSFKDPDRPEVHYSVKRRFIGDSNESAILVIETDQLAHPHIWAREIADGMCFAGWKGTLRRIDRCETTTFASPTRGSRLGYAAELKFISQAGKEQPSAVVKASDIVAAIKDAGIKLKRDHRSSP